MGLKAIPFLREVVQSHLAKVEDEGFKKGFQVLAKKDDRSFFRTAINTGYEYFKLPVSNQG
jgi:hypothetical protein